MKIVKCPKGGKVPKNYCRESCLNYPGKAKIKKRNNLTNSEHVNVSTKSP